MMRKNRWKSNILVRTTTDSSTDPVPGPGSCPGPGGSEEPAHSGPSGWTCPGCNPHPPGVQGNTKDQT